MLCTANYSSAVVFSRCFCFAVVLMCAHFYGIAQLNFQLNLIQIESNSELQFGV